ncbi:MAG TPA: DNA-directed RNA polymerase subunit beta', partial [Myxococcales bacterium]|nr:DNA-directed RNA polymerase subunit beta' [Myxococcales bacterium]
SKKGICSLCYGRDLSRGRMVSIGEAVGVIAAQSIGEPGTQLTMRTFHIGGTATRRAEASTIENRHGGTVHFHNLKTVKRKDSALIAMNRNGEVAIADENGRERERYGVIYGAKLNVRDGQKVEAGIQLAEWDPFAVPIVAEVPGTVRFNDIIEGVTMNEQLDEVTGLSRKSIIESRDADSQPRLTIEDDKGNPKTLPGGEQPARYNLPVGANIVVNDGDQVDAGEVIARIPRETAKTKDITGGLPRVAELFEARKPKEHAVISEIEGVVSFGKDTKGKRKVIVTPDIDGKLRTDMATEYLIGKGKHINVHAGDRVKAGDPLMDGAANPHDILKVLGEKELARYMVDEVQEVYRLQGVKINDKHIETIVRQMLRRVRVSEVGDTNFLIDEQVEKGQFDAENERVVSAGGKPATGEPLLLGITKASLSTESFISASSFQETTKVLTEAAISGRVDYLRGLKENVIMGRLIPAGTGLSAYKHLDIEVETPVDEVEAAEEALAIAAGAEPPAPVVRAEE